MKTMKNNISLGNRIQYYFKLLFKFNLVFILNI